VRSSGKRRPVARSLALAVIAATGVLGLAAAPAGPARAADDAQVTQCGATVSPAPARPRQINLVLDDSGSMFSDGSSPLDRWSAAKYSVEVFAAMLDTPDTLNVYRMSDFANGARSGPRVKLTGTEPASARVAKIHDMQLVGGGTPYAPVNRAYSDLVASQGNDKWLVILSDGEFNDRATKDVDKDLLAHVRANRTEAGGLRVAFLAIGPDAPKITNDPARGVYFEHARTSAELLGKMTGFSNRIFQRNELPSSAPGHYSPNIDLEQVLVFAQGQNVTIGGLSSSKGSAAPVSTVEVSWAANQRALAGAGTVPAVPNKNLHGKLATFTDVPRGDLVFDITGAKTVDVFYQPRVNFGVHLVDSTGKTVATDKIVGGEYTLDYGFMDDSCAFIQSDLLGDVQYTARVYHDGTVIADDFASGDSITLERGDVRLDVSARYLDGNTASADIGLKVLRPARPTGFTAAKTSFPVSTLAADRAPEDALKLHYGIRSGTALEPFSAEEWASFTPESFHVTSDSNIAFTVSLGPNPGDVFLLPHAPGGDVVTADTGDIPIHIAASHVYDEQLNETTFDTTVQITDDIPWLTRAMAWFATVGWKLLLGVIAVVILLGYLFKRRFSKKMKARPRIIGTPRQVGVRNEESTGKFTVSRSRRWLPFLADVATLSVVPAGVAGFRVLKLKAGPRKSMLVENWKLLAQRANVSINGIDIDAETKRQPVFSPSATITASTPQMTYEMTPNA
jgi:hypothetical protein